MANSVDLDQRLHYAASDRGLHCLQSLSVPILRVSTVYLGMLVLKFEQIHLITSCSALDLLIEWQTVMLLMKHCILWHLIWVYAVSTACLFQYIEAPLYDGLL